MALDNHIHPHTHTHTHTEATRQINKHKESDTQSGRERGSHIKGQRDRQTETDRQTDMFQPSAGLLTLIGCLNYFAYTYKGGHMQWMIMIIVMTVMVMIVVVMMMMITMVTIQLAVHLQPRRVYKTNQSKVFGCVYFKKQPQVAV